LALLFKSDVDRADWWAAELRARLPDLEVRVWPEVGEPADIEFALVWKPPKGDLARYPNLKAVFSLGAGVDHLLRDPDLPAVPMCRVVDPQLTREMSEYVLFHVLRFHRNQHLYDRQQRSHTWLEHPQPAPGECRVGIMGLGVLGGDAARTLAAHGFEVAGWSRTAKTIDGVETFHGAQGLAAFLGRTEILVCMLPLTPDTAGILDATLFAALPAGASLINCARGGHLVEDDLSPALDAGRLAAATLDVFAHEPLAGDHPFWDDPRICVTPHIASISDPRSVADQVAENIRRARAGADLLNVVDRAAGY